MPRIIFKCPHLKGGSTDATAHLGNYVKYIATREGVEVVPNERGALPATAKQKQMVAQLLRDFPASRELFEYEDYQLAATRANASEFITTVLEHNYTEVARRENYVDYIATRPRVQQVGAHGLFDASGQPVVLVQAAAEVAAHTGNVWMPIISLRREDAARLGYDDVQNWQALLRAYAGELAEGLKIRPENLKWYAAYHDEGHHPHIHMVCYSSVPREGFLTKDGIRKIKGGLAKRIFRQELTELYTKQTVARDELTGQAREVMEQLVREMQAGVLKNERIEQLTAHLAERLRHLGGKKQYGYLKAPLKAVVDAIVDELAQDIRVARCYAAWCEARGEVLRTYRGELPAPLPLSAQKEFKAVRNMVVQEALNISEGVFTFEQEPQAETQPEGMPPLPDAGTNDTEPDEPPQDDGDVPAVDLLEDLDYRLEWTKEYKLARRHLFGSAEIEQDFEKALRLFQTEAAKGNALAMHDLGRMYTDGLGCEADADTAHQWYSKALAGFHAVEQAEPGRYVWYRIGKMYNAGLGTGQNHAAAAKWFSKSAAEEYKYAQYSLARLYRHGKGVAQDLETAAGLYRAAADQDFPYASFEYGKMLRDGTGVAVDTELAGDYFRDAFAGFVALEEQSHDDKLQYRLGWMHLNGVGTVEDVPAAREMFEKAAAVGNTFAMYQMAKLILADEAATPDEVAHAVELLTQAADADSVHAIYALAKLYRDGGMLGKDVPQAVALFTRAAGLGSDYAAYAIGELLLAGEDIPKDVPAAIGWLEQAAEAGNEHAQYALGKLYQKGEDVPQDIAKAAVLFRQAAGQGNQFGAYQLGKLLLAGEGVPRDVPEAVRWLEMASGQGNQFAQYALGKLYANGEDVPRDVPKAASLFHAAALQDNEYAAYQLGKLLLAGDGIPKDVPQAVRWLEQAAGVGNQFAQYTLGKLYADGEDVPRNAPTAASLFHAAALQGSEHAAYQLGKLLLAGDGIPKDVPQAMRWLDLSAGAGNQYAQYTLGKLHLLGRDVPRDREAAAQYLTLAAGQGNEYAQFFLDNIDSFHDPSAFLAATRMLHHLGNIFRDNTPAARSSGGIQVDSKLRRKMREKKMAQGHKRDDHAPEMSL